MQTQAPLNLSLPAPDHVLGLPTPRLIQIVMGLIFLSTLIAWGAAATAAYDSRHAIQVIGRDTTPSILAALKIRTDLADLDANEAALFLCAPDSPEFTAAQNVIHTRLDDLGDNLIAAAQNINHGDADRVPLLTLQDGLPRYEQIMAQAQLLHRLKRTNETLQAFRDATDWMHEHLLPAADDLCDANKIELQSVYNGQHGISTSALAWQIFVALILLAEMLWLQWFLRSRTRRLINPAVLIAFALTFLIQADTAVQVMRAEEQLRVMKEDCFDSIYALAEARAVCFDLNGDETRWLFDTTPANEHAFFKKVEKVVNPPAGMGIVEAANATQRPPPAEYRGFLFDELRNITFVGEQEAAEDTLKSFAQYCVVDTHLRQLEKDTKHADAVALAVSSNVGSPRYALGQFDTSLGNVLRINQFSFDNAMKQGVGDLAYLDWELSTGTFCIILLVFVGLRPRLREYAG